MSDRNIRGRELVGQNSGTIEVSFSMMRGGDIRPGRGNYWVDTQGKEFRFP